MKLFIGICNSQDVVPSGFFWSFVTMKCDWPVKLCRGGQPWDIIRNNYLISEFLKSDADVFVKMDIDQLYPPSYFQMLVPLVERYKVVGPLIKDRHKQSDFMPLVFSEHNGQELKKFNIEGLSGVQEIPYAHTNLFYSREVLERIKSPWYEVQYSDDGLERTNHVDFSFLDKIKKAGYPIYINLDVRVGHKKPTEYVT